MNIIVYNRFLLLVICLGVWVQCTQNDKGGSVDDPLFQRLVPEDTQVDFENVLSPSEDFNMYLFRNFYNGGGVAVGDVTGNGLPDIFLTGNMTSNRLYINQDNFTFLDVTDTAGLDSEGYWSTGASMADVNGDGLLDIYVTLSGKPNGEKRYNRLYINQGDTSETNNGTGLTFSEKALEYNLRDEGLSTHGVFFDYNNDGYLDLYLISHSYHELSGFDGVTGSEREKSDPLGASKLYRNDGDSFTDVTQEAGIFNSRIGFGLSAAIADLNRNGRPDIYVANDFFERDYLYINNGDGTFTESLDERIRSISFSSMGSDIADINNDSRPDIFVTDMLPGNQDRLKSKMTLESWEEYRDHVERGFHHKFTRNTLQLNNGNGTFSEIGRLSNVFATDWSWATLIADFDHSGYNDIFVANGIYKDLLDQDYIEKVSNPRYMQQMMRSGEEDVILNLMEMMTSTPLHNRVFKNLNGIEFADATNAWGLMDQAGFSSGAAWADLNGDGALDLIINDVNGRARIYRNRTNEINPDRSWLKVELRGEKPNTFGIGAKLHVWTDGEYRYREHYLQRGFQSSVEPGLHMGLGVHSIIDSLIVEWPDGKITKRKNVEVPGEIRVIQAEASNQALPGTPMASMTGDLHTEHGEGSTRGSADLQAPLLEPVQLNGISEFRHAGYEYNDFNREQLLVHMRSTEGPALCVGDADGNGLEDLYMGGARGQPGVLWIQDSSGEFVSHQAELFQEDQTSEDIDCTFFDATGNGMDDLYVVSGGNSFSSSSSALSDRLYLNNGEGLYHKTSQILPSAGRFESGSVVKPQDFTGDGNMDLFVGTRLKTFAVGMEVNGYLLKGDGTGNFTDVTEEWAPELIGAGMITDAIWADVTGDQSNELIVTGEWMPVRVFSNSGDKFVEITEKLGLAASGGWWNTIAAVDVNGNGRVDLIGGNHGLNSIFKATPEQQVKMWVDDFSNNGVIEQILAVPENGEYYPVALLHEMTGAIPGLREKFPTYASYAGVPVESIFSESQLNRANPSEATVLASAIFWNHPDGFELQELPLRSQLAPVYDIEFLDLDGDNLPELILGGNLFGVKPHIGPYDASRGIVLTYKNGEIRSLRPGVAGMDIPGEIRRIRPLKVGDELYIIVSRYDNTPVVLKRAGNAR